MDIMSIIQLENLYTSAVPLIIFMIFGFILARFNVDRKSIANIITYVMLPTIYLRSGWSTPCELRYLALPLAFFALSCLICVMYLLMSSMIWKDKVKNLVAFSAGSGSVGYFTLAIVLALFPQNIFVLYLLASLGATMYQYSLGVWVVASGSYSAKDAFIEMLKIPVIYAFAIGMVLNSLGIPMPTVALDFFMTIKQCSVVLGLMMIGISMPKSGLKIDWRFFSMVFSARFLVSPLIVLIFIFFDMKIWHLYDFQMHCIFLLLSLAPPAVNTIVFATLYDNKVEEAATTVLLSTIFLTFFFPLAMVCFKFFAMP